MPSISMNGTGDNCSKSYPAFFGNLMSSAMAEFPLCGARLEVSLLINLALILNERSQRQLSRDIKTF